MPSSRTPWFVVALVLLVALGACAIAAASVVPAMLGGAGAWPVLVVGLTALLVGLTGLGLIQEKRDRTLR